MMPWIHMKFLDLKQKKECCNFFTRLPYQSGEKVSTVPLLVAVGKEFITTVSNAPLPFLKKWAEKKCAFPSTQVSELFITLLEEIDVAFMIFLSRIARNIRSISAEIEDIENEDIIRFVRFEGILNDLLAALVPMNAILQKLSLHPMMELSAEQKDMVEDFYLNNHELQELSKNNFKSIVNVREGYSTIMSNNLNKFIKILTALTVSLTIPTIISSMYGMNIRLPFADSPFAFWYVIGITGVFALLVLVILLKKKW